MESAYLEIKRLFPSLRIKFFSLKGSPEEFSIRMAGSVVHIQAASPLARKFAMSQLLAALQNGRVGDIVGNNKPLFDKRLLWIKDGSPWLDSHIEHVVDLGYNSVVVTAQHPVSLSHIRSKGLKVIIELSDYDQAEAFYGSCDFFLCKEGMIPNQKKNLTECEKAAAELQFLEQNSKIPIIYYVSSKEAEISLFLANVVSSKSIIAFSAASDESRLNKLFSELVRVPVAVSSRLLPLLSIHQHCIGEGTWFSDFPLAFIENVLGRQRENRFCGAGVVIDRFVEAGSLAECPLWATGQRMWHRMPVYALIEAWIARYHPEWQELFERGFFEQVHQLLTLYRSTVKTKKSVDTPALKLKEIIDIITEYKREIEYQKISSSLEVLFLLLNQFQIFIKKNIERLCQESGQKIPLLIQEL